MSYTRNYLHELIGAHLHVYEHFYSRWLVHL